MMIAGKLKERVTLAKRRVETNPDAPDDYGNTVADWADQGTVWAQITYLRGGEGVIAGRLQGRVPVVIRLWASALSRSVATDWRVTHDGTDYAVRSVNPDPEGDDAWIDLLCEGGVAA
jgi:SPP1 family predicted phage head-tail adaptor